MGPLLALSRYKKKDSVAACSMYAYTDILVQNQASIPNAAYAPSKAVQHWYTKAIHLEEPTITAFAIHPG